MTLRARTIVTLGAVIAALSLPAAAYAHAALLRTTPSAGGTLDRAPTALRLTYNEAIEPRFSIVSITNAAGSQQAAGSPHSAAGNRNELDVPLRKLGQGWYLVFWRVVSADGHPERGAFTFAVGPNAGPAPRFAIPSFSETAVTPALIAFRSLVFLSVLAAIGLFVFRLLIARPLVERVTGATLRPVSRAFWIALGIALAATPVYVALATAKFALRSVWSVSSLVPLMRVSQFGRSFIDLELVLLLFGFAAAIALWLDRPQRRMRSTAAKLALGGALGSAAAALFTPGAAGHAAQTSPRTLALGLDWLHLAAASLWLGGLIGLLAIGRTLPVTRRTAGLLVCVPRFSNTAFVSVIVLLGTGIGASLLHLPTLDSLWQTGYGQAIIVKASLLFGAIILAAVNLLRTRPGLARDESAPGAALLLRRLVGGEKLLVTGALVAAAVLTSLPPPPKALASIGTPAARTGPGPVSVEINQSGYRLNIRLEPNRAAVPNTFAVRINRNGQPVAGARVTTTLTMLDMAIQTRTYRLREKAPGVYENSAPALVMVGSWGLTFKIKPVGKHPLSVVLVDHAAG